MPEGLVIRGAEELSAKLRSFRERMPAATPRMLYHAGEAIRSYMLRNYLSGQRLRRITGRLANSFSTMNVGPDTAIVGTPLVYARPLEEGFHGPVMVRPFMRARRRGGAKEISVIGHIRQANVRARYYARDAAQFGAPEAIAAAEAQLRLALREAGLGE